MPKKIYLFIDIRLMESRNRALVSIYFLNKVDNVQIFRATLNFPVEKSFLSLFSCIDFEISVFYWESPGKMTYEVMLWVFIEFVFWDKSWWTYFFYGEEISSWHESKVCKMHWETSKYFLYEFLKSSKFCFTLIWINLKVIDWCLTIRWSLLLCSVLCRFKDVKIFSSLYHNEHIKYST